MDKYKARNYFPHLEAGMIYMNHAATGPVSSQVREKLNEFLFNKCEDKIDDYQGLLVQAEKVRTQLSRLINSSPDRIAFIDNTTNGINLLAQGIQLRKGDRVLLNDIEFPANVYPFLNLEREGVVIDWVKSSNGIVTAEEVLNNIKPETKIVSISQVQFLSGYRVELEKIGKVCREKGIIFCVDAIQGLGAVQLDVVKDYIDFISCGTQKWMLGLQGLAFIYISKELQEKLIPDYVGWLGVENAWSLLDYELKLKSTADGLQTGTVSVIGIYALSASLDLFNEFGWNQIEEKVIGNSKYFLNRLGEIGITTILKDCPDINLAGIISFKHAEAQKIYDSLAKKKIFTAVRQGVLRISPHFYNSEEDIEKVIAELWKM